MITHEPMTVYKNIGTYHLVQDDGYDEDTDSWYEPFKHYEVRHFSGLTVTASSVKECKKCLDDLKSLPVKSARLLTSWPFTVIVCLKSKSILIPAQIPTA